MHSILHLSKQSAKSGIIVLEHLVVCRFVKKKTSDERLDALISCTLGH